jgi:drug/metabolite transporter (DMT)-like permease
LLIPGQASGAMKLDKGARKLFLVAGLGSGFANGFRFSALALAPVSMVIPLMRSSVLFTLALNYVFNRHLESFEPKVLGGIFISMVGAILLVI